MVVQVNGFPLVGSPHDYNGKTGMKGERLFLPTLTVACVFLFAGVCGFPHVISGVRQSPGHWKPGERKDSSSPIRRGREDPGPPGAGRPVFSKWLAKEWWRV